jgi:hypothetical protein
MPGLLPVVLDWALYAGQPSTVAGAGAGPV